MLILICLLLVFALLVWLTETEESIPALFCALVVFCGILFAADNLYDIRVKKAKEFPIGVYHNVCRTKDHVRFFYPSWTDNGQTPTSSMRAFNVPIDEVRAADLAAIPPCSGVSVDVGRETVETEGQKRTQLTVSPR